MLKPLIGDTMFNNALIGYRAVVLTPCETLQRSSTFRNTSAGYTKLSEDMSGTKGRSKGRSTASSCARTVVCFTGVQQGRIAACVQLCLMQS